MTGQKVNGVAQVGDLVSYEDIANQPRRTYRVEAGPLEYGQYQLAAVAPVLAETEGLRLVETRMWSDLRQWGWRFEGDQSTVLDD